MKQVLSVWMAAARQIIWKLLLILILMIAAEVLLVYRCMPEGLVTDGRSFGFEMQHAGIRFAFWGAMLFLTVLLCWQGMDDDGKLRYTLYRLPMGESAVTSLWVVHHLACYVIVWAVQIMLVLVFWNWHLAHQAGHTAPQLELYVDFYRDGFLHSLMPMANVWRWLRNISWVLCLSVSAAHHGFVRRRGKNAVMSLGIVMLGLVAMNMPMGSMGVDMVLIMIYGSFLGVHLHRIWRRSDEEN